MLCRKGSEGRPSQARCLRPYPMSAGTIVARRSCQQANPQAAMMGQGSWYRPAMTLEIVAKDGGHLISG